MDLLKTKLWIEFEGETGLGKYLNHFQKFASTKLFISHRLRRFGQRMVLLVVQRNVQPLLWSFRVLSNGQLYFTDQSLQRTMQRRAH